jgi:acyl-CoA thioester hydrolase
MPYTDFRHRMPLRVRWAEVDRQGVVFNAHYLMYCDVCATEYWRAIGMPYPQDFLALGCDTYVRKATIDYAQPAVYDDELEVCGRIARLGKSSLRFVVEIFARGKPDAPMISVEIVYVAADPATLKPVPVPPVLRERIRAFEAVAPVETDGPRDGAH